jgi:hypothetical protein
VVGILFYYLSLLAIKNIFMMKFIGIILLFIGLTIGGYVAFIYNFSYSEGFRAGELVKISNKGIIFKTWEGELSQGISEAQLFKFSVESKNTAIISNLKEWQGKAVKLSYKERYGTFPWLGDTKYYITNVALEKP